MSLSVELSVSVFLEYLSQSMLASRNVCVKYITATLVFILRLRQQRATCDICTGISLMVFM